MPERKFGTALLCMDGRIQTQTREWMLSHCDLRFIDKITEPGMDGFLAERSKEELEGIRKKLLISINEHGSRYIAVVGHVVSCVGNPAPADVHREQIKRGVELVRSWLSWELFNDIKIVGLLLNEEWKIEVL